MIFHQPHNSAGNYSYNAVFYRGKQWPLHFHKNMELIYVRSGSVACTVSGREYLLQPHDFGLCLSYEIHGYQPSEDAEYWVAVFSEDYVHSFYRQVENRRASSFRFRCPEGTEQFLLENLVQVPAPTLYMVKSCLYAACDSFLRQVTFREEEPGGTNHMRTIVDYVSENYRRDIRLSDLTDLLGYDYSYVSRYFHSIFHMSFHEFLSNYRMDAALRLLEETDEKITAVALESGFQSVRSFNHCFREQFGITPSEYRQQKNLQLRISPENLDSGPDLW